MSFGTYSNFNIELVIARMEGDKQLKFSNMQSKFIRWHFFLLSSLILKIFRYLTFCHKICFIYDSNQVYRGFFQPSVQI